MNRLHIYLVNLIKGRFHGSIKINFEDGIPTLIKEEKSIDTAPFREEIKEIRKRDQFENN